jgi:hypothetical protein
MTEAYICDHADCETVMKYDYDVKVVLENSLGNQECEWHICDECEPNVRCLLSHGVVDNDPQAGDGDE